MFHSQFWGMHFLWWLFWILLIAGFLGMFEPLPRRRENKHSPMEILKRRYAAGDLSTEEFMERKKHLEEESSSEPSSE